MPFARFLMKIPALGFFAVKRMSRQVLKANGDAAVFLKSAQGKQMLHGCSKTDLKFFHDPPWMSLMYQSMVEAFRQGNIGVKTVLMEHALFMKPWPVSLAKIPEGKLFIWQGTEDKTCRVSNAYLISKAVAGADLEVFQGLGHCVLFDNFERLGSIFCCR
jgi:pimeloyl-ACP methyl ester carboxylesterase